MDFELLREGFPKALLFDELQERGGQEGLQAPLLPAGREVCLSSQARGPSMGRRARNQGCCPRASSCHQRELEPHQHFLVPQPEQQQPPAWVPQGMGAPAGVTATSTGLGNAAVSGSAAKSSSHSSSCKVKGCRANPQTSFGVLPKRCHLPASSLCTRGKASLHRSTLYGF